MFDDLIKKQSAGFKKESVKQAKPIPGSTLNLRTDKFTEKSPKPKAIAPPPPAVTGFEQRIAKLRTKGKKRGKRYSIIGISVSIVICLIVLVGGYYLLTEVIDLSEQVDDGDNTQIDYSAVSDNKCADSCCFDSYKKIKNNNYEEYNENSGCPNGYEKNKLECKTSLEWCEPISTILDDLCAQEGEMISLMPTPIGVPGKQCCEGLIEGGEFGLIDDVCSPVLDVAICIDCPNKECGPGETKCNCPQDCRILDFATSSVEEIIATSTSDSIILIDEPTIEQDAATASMAEADDDNDGLTNAEEAQYGTNPQEPDTDGDGFLDGEEVKNGYNPLGEGVL